MKRPNIPTARDIMSKRLVTLKPNTPVMEAVRVLLRHKISGVPVVGDAGELLGVYSEFDCLRALANDEFLEDHEEEETVGEHMTPRGHTIPPEMGLYRIAHAFVTLGVRRLPVLEGDRLVGQVSRRDVLRALDKLGERLHDQRRYPDYPEGREPLG
jgi:CBS domain-containing protein